MKVFISWSGDLSRAVAVELREWLPMVVHQVEPWMSKRDIEAGKRWALILGEELELSDFAIICLTKDNIQSPWILFEAGAVARSKKARVIPLLIGITPEELDGPLAQFQSLILDESGTKELVSTLYNDSQSGLAQNQREIVFSQLYHLFDERIKELIVQAKKDKIVESPIDIINDLRNSEELLSFKHSQVQNIYERIKNQRLKLINELFYLNKKEEELTPEDASTSLVERAIVPIERRVEIVDETIETLLDKTLATLTAEQLNLLRSLVADYSTRVFNSSKEWMEKNQFNLNVLLKLGLISSEENGIVIIHDIVAKYISKKNQ